jgi:ribonuclease BN (tRNA processing enzyme)
MKFKLEFLGLGGCFNVELGNTSAFFKDEQQNLFLIDCGWDVFPKLIKYRLLDDTNRVYIFITHLHDDHVGSLASLVFYVRYVLDKRVTVFNPTNNLLSFMCILGSLNSASFMIRKKGSIIRNDDSTILEYEFVETVHVEEITSYSLIIRNKTFPQTIYYSGDSKLLFNKHISLDSIQNLDDIEIYQDVNFETENVENVHMDIETICNSVPPSDRGRIYCMHIGNYDPQKLLEMGFKVPKIYKDNN